MAKKKEREKHLAQALDDAAKPIEFDTLIAQGLIEKDGNWYKVPDVNALPSHAQRKIQKRRMTAKGLKVQFREPRSDIVRLHKELTLTRKP